MTDEEYERTVYDLCKSKGCICKPDITIAHPDPEVPLYVEANVYHDGWCPMYMARQRAGN